MNLNTRDHHVNESTQYEISIISIRHIFFCCIDQGIHTATKVLKSKRTRNAFYETRAEAVADSLIEVKCVGVVEDSGLSEAIYSSGDGNGLNRD
jgi:hypothetical protein